MYRRYYPLTRAVHAPLHLEHMRADKQHLRRGRGLVAAGVEIADRDPPAVEDGSLAMAALRSSRTMTLRYNLPEVVSPKDAPLRCHLKVQASFELGCGKGGSPGPSLNLVTIECIVVVHLPCSN